MEVESAFLTSTGMGTGDDDGGRSAPSSAMAGTDSRHTRKFSCRSGSSAVATSGRCAGIATPGRPVRVVVDQQTQRQQRQRVVRDPCPQRLCRCVRMSRCGDSGDERITITNNGITNRVQQEALDMYDPIRRHRRQRVECGDRTDIVQRSRQTMVDERGINGDVPQGGLNGRIADLRQKSGASVVTQRPGDVCEEPPVIVQRPRQSFARTPLIAAMMRIRQRIKRVKGWQRSGWRQRIERRPRLAEGVPLFGMHQRARQDFKIGAQRSAGGVRQCGEERRCLFR